MPLDLGNVFQRLQSGVQSVESDLQSQMNNLNPDKHEDMIKLQQLMQKWTIATQVESNTMKAISDAIKSTVSNLR